MHVCVRVCVFMCFALLLFFQAVYLPLMYTEGKDAEQDRRVANEADDFLQRYVLPVNGKKSTE